MAKEIDLDKMLQKLLQEASLKKALEDFATIMICVVLLTKTKDSPELYSAAKRKVLETLKGMSIYQQYIKKLTSEN